MKTTLSIAAFTSALASAVSAQAAGPTLGDVMANSGIALNGYVDTSYTYLTSAGAMTSGAPSRVYDREHNSFNLHTINVSVEKLPQNGFGARADLDFGSDANVNAPIGSGATDEFDVQQGYIRYVGGPIGVMAGKFVTLAGAEVIKSPDNFNFSRGILFGYAIPFTHTGVRANFIANDALKFTAGINNGWDVLRDSQSEGDKTVELGVAFTPAKNLTLSGAIYNGEEPGAVPGVGGLRTLIDVVGSLGLTDDMTVALNIDVARQEDALGRGNDAEWMGLAGYFNYRFMPQWRAAARAEVFEDDDGFRTGIAGGQRWSEITATVGFMPVDNVELRAELRADRSNKAVFVEPDGSAEKSQQSIAFEAIYKF